MQKRVAYILYGVIFVGLFTFTGCASVNSGADLSAPEGFITRSGSILYEGDEVFKFSSVNCPVLFYNDSMSRITDPFETRDIIETVSQMGGRVLRSMPISVKRPFEDGSQKMVLAPGEFNEAAFVQLDYALMLCNEYDVRLILPLVDCYDFHGGSPNYNGFRELSATKERGYSYTAHGDPFYTDPQIREDFKKTIEYVLNRVNTFTGVAYKDDKAILAWSTGNELNPTDEWTLDIASYIKSIDPWHLVMDGNAWVTSEASLKSDDIDILTKHYYPGRTPGVPALDILNDEKEICGAGKALIIGEYGMYDPPSYDALLRAVYEGQASGAMIWAIRPHLASGGFQNWLERADPLYYDFHWPGFHTGDGYHEIETLNIISYWGWKMQGLPVPEKTAPRPPVMLPVSSVRMIWWQGSTGAEHYTVQRSLDGEEWITVAADVVISNYPVNIPFNDTSAEPGNTYYYRVIAHNSGGASEPSGASEPVRNR